MSALVWFRSDLRTVDNRALHEACRRADGPVIAVFVATPRQWRKHDWGPPRVDFVLRNVAVLSVELERLGIPLLVRSTPSFGGVPRVLLKLARERRCDALFFNREYEHNERVRDEAVAAMLRRNGVAVETVHDQTVLPPDIVRTGGGEFFKVFTPFRNAWMRELHRAGVPRPLRRPRRRGRPPFRPDSVPGRIDGIAASPLPTRLWPAGERAALRRLDRFIERRIERYQEDRDYPALDGTSTLSPWLACGAISPRQCLQAAAAANLGEVDSGREGVETWISELVWREFYRHVLIGFPRVSRGRAFRRETDRLPWRGDDEAFGHWREGRTGVPLVDAAMRQLAETGWMHNRLRMVVAMYLAKDLFIDWRRGEAFFMNSLVDGDFANNNGGWQWAASTGTDAAPYFRIFNPVRQSERWDAEGRFIRKYCPELADLGPKEIHDPSKLGPERLKQLGYPEPLVDHGLARQRVIEAFKALGPAKR
jgi:deoxyribodipyrimidine photo-lyase